MVGTGVDAGHVHPAGPSLTQIAASGPNFDLARSDAACGSENLADVRGRVLCNPHRDVLGAVAVKVGVRGGGIREGVE